MTTIAASRLADALQALVDARLDTIDRMLLGRVDRQDRLAIVREVETQIFDLLEGRESSEGELDRDDVLAALARLDPPEAYLPDEDSGEVRVNSPRRTTPLRTVTRGSAEPASRLPLASGVLGIVSLVAIGLNAVGLLVIGELAIYLCLFLVPVTFVMSLLAVVFAARIRLRGGWAVTGLVTGIISLLVDCAGGLLLAAEFIG